MKKQLFIGLIVAGACLYYAFRGLSFHDMMDTFRHANPRWIAMAISIYTVGYGLRALRWETLMKPIKEVSARNLFPLMIIGFFANNILPLRMGEFVRAHVTGAKLQISKTASLGTILLERLCDTMAFLSTFVAVALFFPFPRSVERGAGALGVACLLVIASLFVIMRHEQRFHAVVNGLSFLKPAWRTKICDLVSNFAHGVSGMKKIGDVAGALFLSLIIWTIEGTMLYLMAHAFAVPLHYPQSFFLLFFMGLSVTLPQAPGYVGTLELFGVTALAILGIPKTQGLPLILAIHATQFTFILILGIWAMGKEGLSFRKMVSEEKQAA